MATATWPCGVLIPGNIGSRFSTPGPRRPFHDAGRALIVFETMPKQRPGGLPGSAPRMHDAMGKVPSIMRRTAIPRLTLMAFALLAEAMTARPGSRWHPDVRLQRDRRARRSGLHGHGSIGINR